ncbi:MAG: UDP-N-acetylmuramoyl-L-alanyl-D-glutamate--2,6-diaminopimelate ligase [Actinomycetota bacterium]
MNRPKSARERSLSQLANFLGVQASSQADTTFSGVCSDSRKIEAGDLFIAFPGARSHGSAFLATALERGARAILTDQQGDEVASRIAPAIPRLVVSKPRSICGLVASWFYGEPSKSLFVAGVTGTNGKTTTTYLLEQIWRAAGYRSGLIGTIGVQVGEQKIPATHTTPESDELQRLLALMKEDGARGVAMEVSSHALIQERVKSINFQAVGFTNLTQDHLDFHGSMENYFQAKRSLFTHDYAEFGVVSIDSEYGKRLWSEITISKQSISIYGKADWCFERRERAATGFELLIRGPEGISIENSFNLIGEHNLENLLVAIALAYRSGIDPLVIATALPALTGAPGRLESVVTPVTDSIGCKVLVDYAHTPDAVERVLAAVKEQGFDRIIAVLGCGGDRDSAKRPMMGSALNRGADIPIFTSDNPRSENPEKIIDEMLSGVNLKEGGEVVIDRRNAIKRAVQLAQKGDAVVVLGKGHETGQEVNGVKSPFSDVEELKRALSERS